MVVVPHVSAGGLRFGATRADALALFGTPVRESVTHKGHVELHYAGCILRFDATDGGFRELTTWPGTDVVLDDTPLPWTPDAFALLRAAGSRLRAGNGFVVSPEHGLALGDFDDERMTERSIHCFRQGGWDALLSDMEPLDD